MKSEGGTSTITRVCSCCRLPHAHSLNGIVASLANRVIMHRGFGFLCSSVSVLTNCAARGFGGGGGGRGGFLLIFRNEMIMRKIWHGRLGLVYDWANCES